MNEIPVETRPKKKIAKIISGEISHENPLGSNKIKGNEKKKPEIIVTEARAEDLIWLSLNKILLE
jgi:hypothetical protein